MANSKKHRKIVPSTRTTRSFSKYYLISKSCEPNQGAKLLTTKQILQYILYLKEVSLPNYPIYSLIKEAAKKILVFWHMAGIKTILQQSAEKKLKSIWKIWMHFKKLKNR